VAGYELCNEAFGYTYMALECMDAIKEVDSNHIFFLIEGTNTPWDVRLIPTGKKTDMTWTPNLIRPNCVYTIHHWWDYPHMATPYSADAFEMGYCQSAIITSALKELRNLFNAPVLLGEFGVYDYNLDNADAEHCRDIVRNLEDLGIGWWYWMMEKLVRDFGKTMYGLFRQRFESPYYGADVPRTFNPKPFNLEAMITAYGPRAREVGYCIWDYVYQAILGPDAWITVQGPCTVRVREWQTGIWWGTLVNDYIVKIPAGQTYKFTFTTYKEVFAYQYM
jgi:hypothetical protein